MTDRIINYEADTSLGGEEGVLQKFELFLTAISEYSPKQVYLRRTEIQQGQLRGEVLNASFLDEEGNIHNILSTSDPNIPQHDLAQRLIDYRCKMDNLEVVPGQVMHQNNDIYMHFDLGLASSMGYRREQFSHVSNDVENWIKAILQEDPQNVQIEFALTSNSRVKLNCYVPKENYSLNYVVDISVHDFNAVAESLSHLPFSDITRMANVVGLSGSNL